MLRKAVLIGTTMLVLLACSKDENTNETSPDTKTEDPIRFGTAQAVTVAGYDDHIMEPFLSRDGNILFFNNINSTEVNTNLHWAVKVNATAFDYQGELQGVNTVDLEGVPTIDTAGNLYFVYTGDYENTLATIYTGSFNNGTVSGKQMVDNISLNQAGWLNFDVEVSADGNSLYVVDGRYDADGGPYEADIFLATRSGETFSRAADSDAIFAHVNTEHLEYAAAISPDELELYFTRIEIPHGAFPDSQILIARRSDTSQPFGEPQIISELSGFVEGPTMTPDNSAFYYHKWMGDRYELFYRERL